jgi:hypothetical protein
MINELKGKHVRVFFENFHDGVTSMDAICLRISDGCVILKDFGERVHTFPISRVFRIVEIEK